MFQGLLLTADTTCCNLKDMYKVLEYFWYNDLINTEYIQSIK